MFYLFKTESDFFSKKGIYRGQCEEYTNEYITYKTQNTKDIKTLVLRDSCNYYFGFQIGDSIIKIRINNNPKEYPYKIFGGGNKNAFCLITGTSVKYDNDNFATNLSYVNYNKVLFIDRVNKIETEKIEEFLKSKPKLLEKYNLDKQKSDKGSWRRQEFYIKIKYLKLFVQENESNN